MMSKVSRLLYVVSYAFICVLLMGMGVYYVFLKNRHTLVQREIYKVEKRIRTQGNLQAHYKADLQNSSNRFLLKERLKMYDNKLIPIVESDVVVIVK